MKLKCIVAIIAVVIGAMVASAQNKPRKYVIIENLFFPVFPIDHSLANGMVILHASNGTKATGFQLTVPLPEEAKKYAISRDSIPEADELLRLFDEQKSQMMHYTMLREETIRPGDKFPKFTARDIDGNKWTNKDVKGKVMVLNCWFTGCGPCRGEMPILSHWKDQMPDVMFFSSTYEDKHTALPVLEKTGFTWTHLINDRQFTKFAGKNGYPVTIVVDKEGIVRQVEFGTSPLQRDNLLQTIRSLR